MRYSSDADEVLWVDFLLTDEAADETEVLWVDFLTDESADESEVLWVDAEDFLEKKENFLFRGAKQRSNAIDAMSPPAPVR